MLTALILAAALAAPPQYDTVTTADGTRLIGTVVEESPTKGITIQLADGTTRRLERSEVRRIEFSDGSITVWEAPPPAPAAPAPAPAQVAPAPPAQLDTVYFAGGGRVRGRVLEEHPKDGVTVQLSDGTTRHYAPEEVVRIQYGDGSTSRRRSSPRYDEERPAPPPQVAPPPRPIPQPVYTMPPREPPRRSGMPQLVPLYLSLGAGGTWFGGQAEEGVEMDDIFHGQFHLQLEGGLRLNPNVAVGLYMDGGAGDVTRQVRDRCEFLGYDDCVGTSARIGFLVKHTWNPTSPTATWLGVGTGWEVGNVSGSNNSDWDGDGHSDGDELATYTGREMIRLMGGVDYRTNQVLGFGFYGALSWGSYDRVKDRVLGDVPTSGYDDVNSRVHTTFQLGLRMILFP